MTCWRPMWTRPDSRAELCTKKRTIRTVGVLVALSMTLTACSQVPQEVKSRDRLPACTREDVYAPPQQGPEDREDDSIEAFECFAEANSALEPAEIEFTLLGTEGERYQAILQTTSDGTVNYFRELDSGWELATGCTSFEFLEPGIPMVSNCR